MKIRRRKNNIYEKRILDTESPEDLYNKVKKKRKKMLKTLHRLRDEQDRNTKLKKTLIGRLDDVEINEARDILTKNDLDISDLFDRMASIFAIEDDVFRRSYVAYIDFQKTKKKN